MTKAYPPNPIPAPSILLLQYDGQILSARIIHLHLHLIPVHNIYIVIYIVIAIFGTGADTGIPPMVLTKVLLSGLVIEPIA